MAKIKMLSICVLLLVLVLNASSGSFVYASSSGSSDDWTTFRHDSQHTGYSTSTAPETNQLLWSYTTGYWVYSSPAVAGGRVYVGSDDCNVYCLDASTGAKIWSYTTGYQVESSPAVADGRVYVGCWDGNVYCLNASAGTKIWNYPTGGLVVSSPAVADGKVYVGSYDHNVYCLNASTGAKIWSYTTGYIVWDSPAVADGKVYIGSHDGNVYCLDAYTGIKIWSYATGNQVLSSPTVADGRVYGGTYHGNDNVYCLDASTGAKIWSYTIEYQFSSPAVADGKVYVGSSDGVTGYLRCLNASTGALIWSFAGNSMGESSPAVADGKVYVGSHNDTYCLDASTGAKIWNYTTGWLVFSSPAVADGIVYVGSRDHVLYAFGARASLTVVSDYDSPIPSETTSYPVGTNVTASVTSPVSGPTGTQYVCTGWTGTGDAPASGTETQVTFTIEQNSTITWNWRTQYYLTITSSGGSAMPASGWFDAETNVAVTAVPSVGYNFGHWVLDGSNVGSNNPLTVYMGGSHTLQAVFVPFAGDIYIRADGSVDPWNAPIATSDNITYVLTANVFGSLTIERDNIVFDGAGHTFTGSGAGHGITLSGRSNVTVKNTTVINYYGNGNGIGIYLDSSSGNTVSGNNLANNWLGIYLGYSSDNTVSGNNFANNVYGICCYYSSDNNTFSGNTFTANQNGGIVIGASSNNNVVSGNNVANSIYAIEIHSSSSNNTVSGNNATNSVAGIYLDYSSNNNVLSGNNITNNYYGILLGTSSGNTFFHNRLVNNVQQVSSDGSLNAWDNGYPSGGNYWSNYAGTDVYSGPGQNVPRSDGIGDAPYVIGSNNVDHYPLYASTFTPQQLIVTVLPSNEGITDPLPGDYYAYANPVIVSATPNVGYQFDHWMLDGVGAGTSPSITVTMGGSHTLQAVFVPFAGDIYIRADGSVDPWNAPIATSDNITYVLTANVFGSLTIERDNIVFDGAGHTFTGSGAGHGITLSGRSNVTVKNTTVINYYGNGNGIGIYLDSSSGNTLSGNTVANNDHGIDLVSAYNNVLSDNTVTASNGWGIYLLSSSGNVLSGNNVTSNTDYGIWLSSSSGNVLSGNNVTSNTWYGIWISSSPYTALSGNNAANNFYGIWLSHSSNCILSGNNVTNNRYGICLYSYSSDNNTLSENSVTANNQDGIYIYGSSGNVLSGNNVSYNGYGIYLDSSFSNTIFHNRFVNNTNQVYSTGQANVWDNGYPSGGNYWSNYAGTDVYSGPGQNVPRSDGIGDTPYTINENNRDNYPWMAANYTAPYQITFDQTGVGDDFGSPVITVDGADYNRSGVSFWWIDGSSHTFAYASPLVATANVKQYVLTGVTASSPYTVSGSATITCSYKTQYNVTFAQSGLDSDASGTVVTIGGSAKVKADLPLTDWFDNETVYSYETIVSGGSGKQFAKTGITGPASPITASGTVNASYKTQYFLTMNTAFGTTNPVSGWFDARSKISISAAAPSAILGERYTSFRWTGIGAGSYTGSSNLATVTMKSPIWETAAWAHQYQLTIKTIGVPSHYSADVSLGGHDVGHASDASPFTMWITTGASTGTIGVDTSVSAGSNTRYVFTLWSDGPTSNPRSSITMSAPQTLTANYKTVYKTTFSLSGVGRDFSGTVAIIDGVSYARSSLPVSFWWDKDSTHSFEYKSPLTVKTGSYVWKSTKGLSSKQSDTTFTVSSAGTITGNYVK